MVGLSRRAAPPALALRQSKWTSRWKAIRAAKGDRDWATGTAKKLLKPALSALSFNKCAFCETMLHEPNEPHIEHYIAKTVEEDRAFEWENLLPCCSDCNTAKANADHQGTLLKPDAENPEPFFWLNPANGDLEPHPELSAEASARAAETIRLCNLKRGALSESRRLIWLQVRRWVERAQENQAREKNRLREELNEFLSPSREHKFVIRLVLSESHPALSEEDRRRFAAGQSTSAAV